MAKTFFSMRDDTKWLKVQRSDNPDCLVLGVKDKRGVHPQFTKLYRTELVELRDTINRWLRESHNPNTEGEL